MNIFAAAVYSNSYMAGQNRYLKLVDREKDVLHKLPHILESFHYVDADKAVQQMRRNGAKVFLDSGAFSAWTLGATIDINAYCDYIKRNRDILRIEDNVVMASVLDGIGDPLKTWQNQLEMERQGATPLPCFHFGEDERYLEWYMGRYPYITLGGMVGKTSEQLKAWLDRLWDRYLTDGAGRPRLKVHGFGITAVPIMGRYPWHSVDSSSWIQTAAFGNVMTPRFGPISVSSTSPSRHDEGRHITTFTDIEQEAIRGYIAALGFNVERLSQVYESRAAFNLLAYGMLNDEMNALGVHTFKKSQPELFDNA